MEYCQWEFQNLFVRATTVRIDQQVDLFTAGLTEGIRLDVEMQRPPNLATKMNWARAFERKQLSKMGPFKPCSWVNLRPPITAISPSAKPPMVHGNSTQQSSMSSITTPFIKRPSRAEQRRQQEGRRVFVIIAMKHTIWDTNAISYFGLSWKKVQLLIHQNWQRMSLLFPN